jgi:hypothetical protein
MPDLVTFSSSSGSMNTWLDKGLTFISALCFLFFDRLAEVVYDC